MWGKNPLQSKAEFESDKTKQTSAQPQFDTDIYNKSKTSI